VITFLDGVLEEKTPARVVLNVAGIGYEVFIPLSSYDRLPEPGRACRLLTYDHIREEAHALYGFGTEAERKLFILLLGVSGIGPKLAMSTLSGLSPRDLIASVAGGDVKRLGSISGIGKKTAERIVVELRDKVSSADLLSSATTADPGVGGDDLRLRDAVMALIALGYKQAESHKMALGVLSAGDPRLTVEDIVRKALVR